MRRARIFQGDVMEVARTLDEASFDACLCDPPYGLSFMGKRWDHGVPSSEVWAEVLRVLKPGAMLLAFGGTRTHHRLMVAIEDAGFEIRDCLMWLYGSGFPKSHDISKAIDKAAGMEREAGRILIQDAERGRGATPNTPENSTCAECGRPSRGHDYCRCPRDGGPATPAARFWSGYGTALKPSWEPIVLAMKPCRGTFAQNALKHGVAGLNVDGGRIPVVDSEYARNHSGDRGHAGTRDGGASTDLRPGGGSASDAGRWPANVLLDDEAAAMLDEQSGERTSGANPTRRGSDKFRNNYGDFTGQAECVAHRGADSGGASRFFYTAKVGTAERGDGNNHPTLKPVDLTAYLAKLILPPERDTPRRLLVPFCGSGSEIIGALRAGWDEATGIEIEPEYAEIAENRIRGDAPLLNEVSA